MTTNEGVQSVTIGEHKIPLYRDGNDTKSFLFQVLPILPKEEIQLLQQADYCKEKLDLNFPLLSMGEKNGLDANGYRRYYPELLWDKFYVCSQWYDKPESPNFEMWIEYVFELRERYPQG